MNETKNKRYTVSYVYDCDYYYIDEDNEDCGCEDKTFIDDLPTAEKAYNLVDSCCPVELREHIGADGWSNRDWEYSFGNSVLLESK